jgi:hypothetical protein
MALAILLILVGIWLLINLLNGNLVGWVDGTIKINPVTG